MTLQVYNNYNYFICCRFAA